MKVTALITAYNCERFIGEAVDSALAQDYAGPLEVLVIDDGSTDGTAAALEARHDAARAYGSAARHLRVIHQPNAGYVAATERGVAEARGELIALLDGDDAWPADKLTKQVQALGSAGLLYGDMTVIDAQGEVLDTSWLGDVTPPCTLADWLHGNAATSSSIVVRTELARRWCPIPVPFPDWYFAIRAMQESEVVYLPEPRTLYRFHGENMSLGSSGTKRAAQLRETLVLQRWFLRRYGGEWAEFDAFQAFALELQRVEESPFTRLVPVTARDRQLAREDVARGEFVRALAADPWCQGARRLDSTM
jgi:glycosyltransferase involved in cell wall biosynthesis